MNILQRILIACIDVIRPALGPDNVCIYEPDISCGNYAKELIKTVPFYRALPKIGIRLLFCNPITALYLRRHPRSSRGSRQNPPL